MHNTLAEIGMMSGTKNELLKMISCEVSEGKENVACHVESIGKLVDMVKDLCEAEKECMEKKYYEMMVCEMMTDGDDMEEIGRMGYDKWHYASGKFAPKGKGHRVATSTTRSGFNPMPLNPIDRNPHDGGPYWHEDPMVMNYRMGYPMDDMGDAMHPSRYGQGFDNYKERKKHYTETGSEQERMDMNSKIEEATYDSLDAMREMWADANPEVRTKLMGSVNRFLEEMKKMK